MTLKSALASGLRGAPAPQKGQKQTILETLENIAWRRLDMPQKRFEASTTNPLNAATSQKSRFLGLRWPILALCYPILEAILAHLGGFEGAILGYVVQNVKSAKNIVNHSANAFYRGFNGREPVWSPKGLCR